MVRLHPFLDRPVHLNPPGLVLTQRDQRSPDSVRHGISAGAGQLGLHDRPRHQAQIQKPALSGVPEGRS